MASMTISLGTVGACALSRKNLHTYAEGILRGLAYIGTEPEL
jgi:hypothetical protein